MKKIITLLAIAAVLAMVQVSDLGAAEKRTLTGGFVWNNGASGDLEAVFTPTAENAWDVAFHFEFRGKPHTYSGTAEGNLSSGGLKGTVKNEDKRRTFTFEGEFDGDEFKGAHQEIGRDGKGFDTGTLSLSE